MYGSKSRALRTSKGDLLACERGQEYLTQKTYKQLPGQQAIRKAQSRQRGVNTAGTQFWKGLTSEWLDRVLSCETKVENEHRRGWRPVCEERWQKDTWNFIPRLAFFIHILAWSPM